MLDKFCDWLKKSTEFTNSTFILIMTIVILLISFIFDTVDKYDTLYSRVENLEILHNQTVCPYCKSVIDK